MAKEKPKRDYVQEVANRLIEQLKAGTAPWQKPWAPGESWAPRNPTSGRDYRGLNSIWLAMQGRADPRWMTFKQAAAMGAQVRKGEKGTLVQYWMWRTEEKVRDAAGNPVLDSEGRQLTTIVELERPRVLSSIVFNAEQIDGLPPLEQKPLAPEWERNARAEAIIAASPAPIRHVPGDRAYYLPSKDTITLPLQEQFVDGPRYYATALHEIGHSTGHPTRLNRDLAHPFGSPGYAREELVAEIASLMLGEALQIGHDPGQHAAYTASWIKALENDPSVIFKAAAQAEKVKEFVLGLERTQELTQAPAKAQDMERLMDGPTRDDAASAAVETPLTLEKETPMHTSEHRVNLAVPFSEKDAAKALGARWDKAAKVWYAPPGVDLNGLERWRPAPGQSVEQPRLAPEAEFKVALEKAGFVFKAGELPKMDGKLHRVPVLDDGKGDRSGAYRGYTNDHPAGFIQNHRSGLKMNWKSEQRSQSLSSADRERLLAESQERLAAREAREKAMQRQAGQAIGERLDACPAATADHPYLAKKGVGAHGLKVMAGGPLLMPPGDPEPMRFSGDGQLLVPVRDLDGQVWGAQSIGDNGRKSFARGARLSGCFHLIGDLKAEGPVITAEGYATAATLHEATGHPVAVAFTATNLLAVAEQLRERYPDRELWIAGDNDHLKARDGKRNVGAEKAREAAREVGGIPLLPTFREDERGSDWNDLKQSRGEGEVLVQIRTALAIDARKERAAEIGQERANEQRERATERPKERTRQRARAAPEMEMQR